MSRLTLLGTVHRDPLGFARLVEVLGDLKPDVITLEFSVYGLHYRQLYRRRLRKRLITGLQEIVDPQILRGREYKCLLRTAGVGGIIAFLDLPFEYKGASFYSKHHHLPFFCLDLSSWSRTFLSTVDELISPSNLKKVISFETRPLQEAIEEQYSFAMNILKGKDKYSWQHLMAADKSWEDRDRVMGEKVRQLLVRFPRKNVVHICGWQHLVSRDGTLFSHLKNMMPRRIFLREPSLNLTTT